MKIITSILALIATLNVNYVYASAEPMGQDTKYKIVDTVNLTTDIYSTNAIRTSNGSILTDSRGNAVTSGTQSLEGTKEFLSKLNKEQHSEVYNRAMAAYEKLEINGQISCKYLFGNYFFWPAAFLLIVPGAQILIPLGLLWMALGVPAAIIDRLMGCDWFEVNAPFASSYELEEVQHTLIH